MLIIVLQLRAGDFDKIYQKRQLNGCQRHGNVFRTRLLLIRGKRLTIRGLQKHAEEAGL